MKKLSFLIVSLILLSFTSCGTILGFISCGTGMVGTIYTGYTTPVTATSNTVGNKIGTSSCTSVLGIIAIGDAGIQDAVKDGGITKISHVDVKTTSILGLFTKLQYFVYGD